ncbi:patatin-like phospholipase family protein [Rhodoblastus sp.]|uniref:patatin-like phospholipase family protein n=2 Tax=Rhodoblastus sp. TaxID=1962975 RepID=UPI003F9E6002
MRIDFSILWLADTADEDAESVETVLGLVKAGVAQACAKWPEIFVASAQGFVLRPAGLAASPMLAQAAQKLDLALSIVEASPDSLVGDSDLVALSPGDALMAAGRNPALILPGRAQGAVLFSAGGPDLLSPERRRQEESLSAASAEAVAAAFAPPRDPTETRKLADFIAEQDKAPRGRRAYNLLLRMIGEKPAKGQGADKSWAQAEQVATRACPSARRRIEALHAVYARADSLALAYSDCWRSILVSRSLLLLLANAVSGLVGALEPSVSSLTMPIQLAATVLTYYDHWVARRGRWLEKWLDYRRLAETLRVERFLALVGGAGEAGSAADWTAWLAQRVSHGAPAPRTLSEDAAPAVLDHLLGVEIADQIDYHQSASARYERLDRHLRRAAVVALGLFVALGAALSIMALTGEFAHRFKFTAAVGLAFSAAPSIYASLNGARRDFDAARQAARSRALAENLRRFAEAVAKLPPTAANARAAAARAAEIMRDDVARWKSVIEVLSAAIGGKTMSDAESSAPILPRDRHLFGPGRKAILSIDGGGVRGVIALGFLARLESLLSERAGAPSRLCDYFDLVGGTSTGAIVATGIALGISARDIRDFYMRLGPRIFHRPWLRLPGWQAKFDAEALRQEIISVFENRDLDSPDLQTGLGVMLKRIDKAGAWILTNNPRSKFWETPPDGAFIGNRHYKLTNLVRASTAAPSYFEPQEIAIVEGEPPALFVDGGLTPHNDPALALFLTAVIPAYHIVWPMGVENLSVFSVGTGGFRPATTLAECQKGGAIGVALRSLMQQIYENQSLTLSLMSWLGKGGAVWPINSEIGDLKEVNAPFGPLFNYRRYDVKLEADWLKDQLGVALAPDDIARLRRFDDPSVMPLLDEIGQKAAERQMSAADIAIL